MTPKEMAELVIAYLQTPEAREELRKGAIAAKTEADRFRQMHKIPLDKLHAPFDI